MRTDVILSRCGLGLLAVYCALCSIFYSSFAEIYFVVGVMPCPVFISEILLLLCSLILATLVWKDRGSFLKPGALFLGVYFLWVVGKALHDYVVDGPLAFRNAALFYYPVTAVFTYVFYRRAQLSLNVLLFAGCFAGIIILCRAMYIWYWLTYGVVFVLALLNTRRLLWRWLGWAAGFIMVIYSLPFLYRGPRAHVLAMACVALFLFCYYAVLWLRQRNRLGLGMAFAAALVFLTGLSLFADHNSVSSVISFDAVRRQYEEHDRLVQARMASFTRKGLAVNLYHPNEARPVPVMVPAQPVLAEPDVRPLQTVIPARPEPVVHEPRELSSRVQTAGGPVSLQDVHEGIKEIMRPRMDTGRSGRTLELNQANIIFRLFVWRDMRDEMIREQAWWGFGFGHPQRSPSLEILDWASEEWSRDGWIAPHNSFFHVIYRAGILGVLLIGMFFFLIIRMIRDFQQLRSNIGGLLVGTLVYWIVAANFSVTFEFPYNAVLFWGWFGLTLAYRDQLAGYRRASLNS